MLNERHHSVGSYVNEILEQAKLTCGDKNQTDWRELGIGWELAIKRHKKTFREEGYILS